MTKNNINKLPDETPEDKLATDAYIDYMLGKIDGQDRPIVDDGQENEEE